MSRAEFSKPTRRDAVKRSGGICEATGAMFGLLPGQRCTNLLSYGVRFEHVNPDANSKDNSLENCACVCPGCWRYKTDHYDKPLVAKTTRQKDKNSGIRTISKPLPFGRGSRFKRKMNGEIVERTKTYGRAG